MGWFGNIVSGAAGLVVIVALPAVLILNGAKEALEDNPEGKDDRLSSESYIYDGKQFVEGATLGVYDADKGLDAENVGDIVYDAGKSTLEFGGNAAKRVFDRAAEDLEGIELPSVNNNNSSPSDPDPKCADPDYMAVNLHCWEQL